MTSKRNTLLTKGEGLWDTRHIRKMWAIKAQVDGFNQTRQWLQFAFITSYASFIRVVGLGEIRLISIYSLSTKSIGKQVIKVLLKLRYLQENFSFRLARIS